MKSNVSDYLELMERVYIDATIKCTADVSDLRDLETIKSRVKDEGISFLTITLPNFAKDFERSLASGKIGSTCFRSFRKHGAIPAFLQGMLSRVFDRETGEMIYHENSNELGTSVGDISTIIESVRQICCTFKKVEIPCSPQRVKGALDSFIQIERLLESFYVSDENTAKFLAVSFMLWNDMVADYSAFRVTPKHGPGATAERVSGNQKYVWRFWHDRLEPYFPLVDNGYPLGIPADAEEFEIVSIVPEEDEQPVRVVPVPKTLKSPRIIAIEPACMQYAQQGIRDYLYDKLESYWLTKGHVNFRDQSVNQSLAIRSSRDGRLATVDLSDASDRVPRNLAMAMVQWNRDLHDSIDACRSRRAQLPDGRLVDNLRKFASMGSALCFPIEAMYFYTCCVVALLEGRSLSYNPRNVYKVTRELYVYGDDMIIPVDDADVILDYLQKYNCKVNLNKTFLSGNFRESCGVDAFGGYEVTPTYLRQPPPEDERQASSIISWVATANLFYKKGYWRSSTWLFDYIQGIIGSLPYVSETSEALGRISFLGYESAERWNHNLQRFEIRSLVPKPVHRTDVLEGYGALMKCFLKEYRVEDDSPPSLADWMSKSDRQLSFLRTDLRQSALHGAVTLKLRWALPH